MSTSHDHHQPAATATQIQPHTGALPSSTPVELSRLDPSHQHHDEPVSPLSPSVEHFATPPQSAAHSTFDAATQGVSPMPDDEQSAAVRHGDRGRDEHQVVVATAARAVGAPVANGQTDAPSTTRKDADIGKKGPPTPPKAEPPQLETKDMGLSAIQPTTSNVPAIGPATSQTHLGNTLPQPDPSNPALQLHILLTTGQRHPFIISRSYLEKRGVNTTKSRSKAGGDDLMPYSISGYTLKELIWRDWRSEWESRPSSPGGIRLISLGRLVDDNKPLSEYFSRDREATSSNHVIHMTIKPADMEDDDHYKKKRKSSVDGEESAGCCRSCTIM